MVEQGKSARDASADRYEMIFEVGSGGMGKVFQARERKTNQVCAIKVMHNHLKGDPINRKRFEREAQVALELRHENIVEVSDFGFTDTNEPFIVMEYLEGKSLQEILREQKRLSLSDFFEIFTRVCDGLSFAHESNVVHRDMKPSNIMLIDGKINKVKIVDFGIAKVCKTTGEICPTTSAALKSIANSQELGPTIARALEEQSEDATVRNSVSLDPTLIDSDLLQNLTQPGEIFGSPLYLSPEQCIGDEADCRSEVYTLGCVMFESLTGIAPLKGTNAMDTLLLRIHNAAPSINKAVDGLSFSTKLEQWIAKALQRNPNKRFQTVADLGAALRGIKE